MDIVNKTKVVVSTSLHRQKGFRDLRMDLYIPTDDKGELVGIAKAVRLECWQLRDEVHPFQNEFSVKELAFAIVCEGGPANTTPQFAPLQHWIAYKALIHYNAWRKHLHRCPERDIIDFEVVLK